MDNEVRSPDQPELCPSGVIKPLLENNKSTLKEEPIEWLISDVKSISATQYAFPAAEPVKSASVEVNIENYIKEECETSPVAEQNRPPDKAIKEEEDGDCQSLSGEHHLLLRKPPIKESGMETDSQEVTYVKEEVENGSPVEQQALEKCTPKRKCHQTDKEKRPRHSPDSEPELFFTCDICEKVMKHLGTFREHQRIHTGERPYKCKICKKKFIRCADLIKHQAVHSDWRPHKCKTCGKKFKVAGALSEHSKVHSDEFPFKCESCDKRFKRTNCLNKHMRSHTEEKPFACDTCSKTFKWESSLREHHRIHSGEKPFQCPDCPKKFTHFSTLQQHKRTHEEDSSFPCDSCDRSFSFKSNLLKHKRTVHK